MQAAVIIIPCLVFHSDTFVPVESTPSSETAHPAEDLCVFTCNRSCHIASLSSQKKLIIYISIGIGSIWAEIPTISQFQSSAISDCYCFLVGGDCCVGSSFWCTDSRERAWAQESHGMLDLSSPTRDRTHVLYIGTGILNHWTTRAVLLIVTLFCIFYIGNEAVRLSVFSFINQFGFAL